MKEIKFIAFLFLLATTGQFVQAQVNVDNIFCLGNGKMAVYEAKSDIIQLFGPPYSSPSLLKMMLTDTSLRVKSERQTGTAIWTHTIIAHGNKIGTIVDFVDANSPTFIRKTILEKPISFSFQFMGKSRKIDNTDSYSTKNVNEALLIESPRGVPFYDDYPMPFTQYLQIAGRNKIHISKNGTFYNVDCSPGVGYLYFVGGPLYPDCISNTRDALSVSYDSLFQRTEKWWNDFTSRRINFDKKLSANVPERDKLLQTIDDVAVAIKTQQSSEGAVIAGHNYHLGYVRDQYGTSRCLLSMGYYREAKDILNFYWNVWNRDGILQNAQGVGVDAFHYAENDEVEITSYLILQAFEYYAKTGDKRFIKKIFSMLEWAWKVSKSKLYKGMLPFNGDETYIAGGILPRSCIIDGSAEATLLFIASGKKIINWVKKNEIWSKQKRVKNITLINKVKSEYKKHFYKEGSLYCNNPDRVKGLTLPDFRYGVCEGRFEDCEYFSWTQKNKNNRYLCPVCFSKDSGRNLPAIPPKRYLIPSVSLVPLYIGSNMFTNQQIDTMLDHLVSTFKNTGELNSKRGKDITVGYDFGMLLYNLTKLNDTLALRIYKKMFTFLDKTGTWSEYYVDGKAMGTRYRPWESGINLGAAILYAEKF